MRSLSLVVFALLVALVMPGCGSSVDLADYDQTCLPTVACTAVPGPDPCECSCEIVAVKASEAQRYLADWNDRQGSCVGANQCKPCPALPAAICESGRCTPK